MKTVILAAGFGSRLWPLSTSEKPKQFQPLIGEKSLLRYTYDLLSNVTTQDELYVLGLEGMLDLIREQVPELRSENVILVPERRNTLPHTLWALAGITDNLDEPVLFKSVDHYLLHPEVFLSSLGEVLGEYKPGPSITLLCTSYQKFNTNDGYCLVDSTGIVKKFLEKPTEQELQTHSAGLTVYRTTFTYIASSNALLTNLKHTSEAWAGNARAVVEGKLSGRKDAFLKLPFMDISSFIFQKAGNLRAVEMEYEFIDVGRFEEIYELNTKDGDSNVIIGKVITAEETRNNLIINTTDEPLVVIGKKDTVIIQTDHGSLVSSFPDASKVGDIYKSQIHGH